MSGTKAEIDDSLYSRQRYVLGDTAMHKLAASKVFMFGLNGVGVEIAKNLILAGVKSVTIHDNCKVSHEDMSCQFYIRDEDIKLSKSRGQASLKRLGELNPYVDVKLHEENIDGDLDFLTDFQCIVMTGCSLKLQLKVNNFCRQHSPQIKFIVADVYGLFCWTFCDFGDEFEVVDRDGEESKEVLISNISKSNPGVVTTADSMMHGFENGDVVTFKELTSMQSLNGAIVPINVVSPFSFSIVDTSSDEFEAFIGRGIVKKIKTRSIVHFKSLEDSLKNPSYVVPDFGKASSPMTIFNGMLALHQYVSTHGRLPRPWHLEDCQQFLSISEDIYKYSNQVLVDEEKNFLKLFCFTSSGCFPPLCAFLGGVAAQEALKALSGKFEPLQQWLLLDVLEIIRESTQDFANYQPIGDRYDAVRICIGEDLCRKLQDANLFMVGCGAIGCELFKNFALLGVACGSGLMTVTDNDLIEKSNLNRQFLFRAGHIQKPKSVIAASSIHQINQKMNIMAQQYKVGWETENDVYPDSFYKQLDIVVNALDNVEARRYVDRRCVSNQKPLLESGTLSTKGHVQVIIPFLTESYNSQNDPDDSHDVPYCTLRSFPGNMEHCIEWARDKFETIFVHRISLFNEFWKQHSPLDVQLKLKEGTYVEHCKFASKMACSLPSSWHECVSLARICFEKWFCFKAKELLSAFPLSTTMEDGSPFWQLPKRPPSPIPFDSSNPLHIDFILSYAKLVASICRLKVDSNHKESALEAISKTVLPRFKPKSKHIETDESAAKPPKEDEISEDEIQLNLDRISHIIEIFTDNHRIPQLNPERFEKDDDSNGHIDFIVSTANLRAAMYGIAAEERLQIKRIAGRIVPAIATTTAAVSALVAVELVKIIKRSPFHHYKNAFLNLAQNMFILSEPGPVQKNTMKSGAVFSIWDQWEIVGNPKMTLDQFIKAVEKKYKEEPTFIVQGTKLLFSSDMFMLHKKRLNQKMSSLLKIVQAKKYVDLVVSFKRNIHEDGYAEDESGPEIRYYHGVPTEN